MNTLVRNLLFASALTIGANGVIAATPSAGRPTIGQLEKQTKALEATTERAQDHRALAAEYRELAQLQFDESHRWTERTVWYAQFPIYSSDKFRFATIDHSRYLARKYWRDAEKSEQLALRHEGLAS